MTKEIKSDSTLINTWAALGAILDPGDTKTDSGWELGEQPPHEFMNYLHNIFGKSINYILANGVPEWNSSTDYGSDAIVRGSDGALYRSNTTPNQNNDPVSGAAEWDLIATSIGTGDNQTPLNSDLGSAANADTGVDPGDVRLNSEIPAAARERERLGGAKKPAQSVEGAMVLTGSDSRQSNPILSFGVAASWDEDGVRGFVPVVTEEGLLADVGGETLAFYTGRSSGVRAIGLAASTDSDLVAWSKEGSNPVFEGSGTGGAFDESQVATGSAVQMDNGDIRLYYAGYDSNGDINGVGLATSTDGGITFSRSTSNPLIQGGAFQGQDPNIPLTGVPHVVKTTLGWYLLIEAQSPKVSNKSFYIYAASSPDGISWTPLNNGYPILGPKHRSWRNSGVANGKITEVADGVLLMTFNGKPDGDKWRPTAAFTTDPNLENWTVYDSAIITPGTSESFDTHRIEDGIPVKDDIVNGAASVRVFYFGNTTNDSFNTAQIGLAEIPQAAEDFRDWAAAGPGSSIAASTKWGPSEPGVAITGTADSAANELSAAFTRPVEFPGKFHVYGRCSVENLGTAAAVYLIPQPGFDEFITQGDSEVPGMRVTENGGSIDVELRAVTAAGATSYEWFLVATLDPAEPFYFDLYVDMESIADADRTVELVINDSQSVQEFYGGDRRRNFNVLCVYHQADSIGATPGTVEFGDLDVSRW